mgnify:CR=1 FL=1
MTTEHTPTPAQLQQLLKSLSTEVSELKPIPNNGTVCNTTLSRLMQDASFKIAEARSVVSLIIAHQERAAAIQAEANAFKADAPKQIDLEAALERVMLQNRGRLPDEQVLVRSVLDAVRRCVNTQK